MEYNSRDLYKNILDQAVIVIALYLHRYGLSSRLHVAVEVCGEMTRRNASLSKVQLAGQFRPLPKSEVDYQHSSPLLFLL